MKLKSFILLSLSITPLLSQAALGPIVITPTRTEQSNNQSSATIYTITNAMIKQSGALTTTDLLRGVPGLQIDDLFGNGSQVSLSVRGFSSTANANTLVLVNGRRMNHSDTASPDIHHISPNDIDRIEILAGSAGVLYGDQAVGGVINIITKTDINESTSITAKIGSYNYKSLVANHSTQINEKLSARASIEHLQANHYRDNNEQEKTNISTFLDYKNESSSVFFDFKYVDDTINLPGALLENEFIDNSQQSVSGFEDDYIAEETTSASVGYKTQFYEHNFNIDLNYRKTDADLRQSFRNSASPSDGTSYRKNLSLNPKLFGQIDEDKSYTLGLDLETTDYDLVLPNIFGTSTASNAQNNNSLFVQINSQLTDKTRMTLGMRHSRVNNDMKNGASFPNGINTKDNVSVREFGLSYLANDNLKYSFRYDENFRFAKVDELALADSTNLLDTQTGKSYEFGINWNFGTHQINTSIYQLNLSNEIVFDPTVGPDFGFGPSGLNVNLDKTQREGFTLSVIKTINSNIEIMTNIGFVNAKYKSGLFKNNEISGVSDKIAKIRIDYLFNTSFKSYLELHHSGEKYAQGDNGNQFAKLKPINTINLGSNYVLEDWNIHFKIQNLTNKKYAEFVTNNGFGAAFQPSPDRNFQLTATYNF